MAYFCSFTSGSKGNSGLLVKGSTRALIDAGTNAKYISSCLAQLGLRPEDLTHIVITHAHSDHVSALPVLLKKTDARIVCTYDTYDQLSVKKSHPLLFEAGDSFELGDITAHTAATPHDCVGSCCYAFDSGRHGLAYCTDMGRVTADIFELMTSCGNLFIESNHDLDMLKNGPYPYYLKQRIMSGMGHLSNVDCADAVARAAVAGVSNIILGHLSETNNLPRLALDESAHALRGVGAEREVLLGAAAARRMLEPMEL